MVLRPLQIFFSYSVGIDFSRQNLTSAARRQILTTNVDTHTVRVNLQAIEEY